MPKQNDLLMWILSSVTLPLLAVAFLLFRMWINTRFQALNERLDRLTKAVEDLKGINQTLQAVKERVDAHAVQLRDLPEKFVYKKDCGGNRASLERHLENIYTLLDQRRRRR